MSASSNHIPAETTPDTGFDQGSEIPYGYGQTELICLARDPFWIFVYWEISPQTLQQVQQDFGAQIFDQATPTIRLYEVGSDGHKQKESIEFSVNLSSRNWYIQLPKEGLLWQLELGLKLKDGRFISLIFSNIVQPPRISDQGYSLQEWMRIYKNYNSRFAGWQHNAESSKIFPQWLLEQETLIESSSWKKPCQ